MQLKSNQKNNNIFENGRRSELCEKGRQPHFFSMDDNHKTNYLTQQQEK